MFEFRKAIKKKIHEDAMAYAKEHYSMEIVRNKADVAVNGTGFLAHEISRIAKKVSKSDQPYQAKWFTTASQMVKDNERTMRENWMKRVREV